MQGRYIACSVGGLQECPYSKNILSMARMSELFSKGYLYLYIQVFDSDASFTLLHFFCVLIIYI